MDNIKEARARTAHKGLLQKKDWKRISTVMSVSPDDPIGQGTELSCTPIKGIVCTLTKASTGTDAGNP